MTEAEQIAEIFRVIEGGAEKAAGEIIQFPADKMAPGAEVLEGVTETVELSNGAAAEVSQLTVVEGGAASATTAGVGLLGMSLPSFAAMAAPFLGVAAGFGLYNLAPEFWNNASEALFDAGETIGGKVRAFMNSATGEVGVSENALNVLKNLFIDAGFYSPNSYEPIPTPITVQYTQGGIARSETVNPSRYEALTTVAKVGPVTVYDSIYSQSWSKVAQVQIDDFHDHVIHVSPSKLFTYRVGSTAYSYIEVDPAQIEAAFGTQLNLHVQYFLENGAIAGNMSTGLIKMVNPVKWFLNTDLRSNSDFIEKNGLNDMQVNPNVAEIISAIAGLTIKEVPALPDSIYPTKADPIHITFPDLIPWELPAELPLPNIYPIEIPAINPNPVQEEAQNPWKIPDIIQNPLEVSLPSKIIDFIIDNVTIPDPVPVPVPVPDPVPVPADPDPVPVPEPVPIKPDPPIPPVPTPPDPIIPTPIIIPPMPDPETTESNALFTVYSPTISQLNALGGYLWSADIIDIIKKMWQNPLDGIINLLKVYAIPTTGGNSTIKLGYLDTQVSAKVVSSQFVTIDCGSVPVPELKHNATDYPPYTSMQLYLPFVGIVELDGTEFVNGSIHVVYRVDVYTGSCLAEVRATRSPDLGDDLLYAFPGMASQQIPLSSTNAGGAISSLISMIGGGVAIAAGGGVAGIAGGMAIGHSLTHEMVHVSRSGSISSNSGILGPRKPRLIFSRRANYDAAMYSEQYGYPANTTVYLGNCSGYTRVKECHIQSTANEAEKAEIYQLLRSGVIL